MLKRWREILKKNVKFSLWDSMIALGILAATTVLTFSFRIFDQEMGYASMLFVLAVFLIARMTEGYFYGVAASLISVLLVNYFFTYPNFRFNFTLAGYPIAILSMLMVSVMTSALTTRAKCSAEARLEVDREITRSNLLRAISHDLRTPLTGILGASSAILDNDDQLTKEKRMELLRDVRDEAQWLIRMVENILTITRMDGSHDARVKKNQEAGEEVLEAAVTKFRKQFPEWKVTVQVPEEFLLIPMDIVLIEQVLMNLLENVVDHGMGANQIWVTLERKNHEALFCVRDNGCGINTAMLSGLFEGNVTSTGNEGDRKRNMGIGLSVCKTIIGAHGGVLEAENAKDGGAIFRFALPLEEETDE